MLNIYKFSKNGIICLLLSAILIIVSQLFAADSLGNVMPIQQPVDNKNSGPYFILTENEQEPFTSIKEFSFKLLEASNLELVIYDIEGRQVRTLITGYLESGEHSFVWDGNNNQGEPVSSGVYRYSVRVHDLEESQIITYLR